MMLLRELIRNAEDTLRQVYPEREARQMVFSLLEHHLGTKPHTHIIEPQYQVAEDDFAVVMKSLERLAAEEPLQYVINQAWFYGRAFRVAPDVLIPRPETELLCREALDEVRRRGFGDNVSVLDLCTGSGCIAWTMALELPGSRVFAADISEAALEVASSQGLSEAGPEFFKADVLQDNLGRQIAEAGTCAPEKFDVILSNPPYVRESEKALMRHNVLDWEPSLALFVPDSDPLKFYRALSRHASALLSENGFGIVEINEAFGEETAELFTGAGFRCTIIPDLSGRPRHIKFVPVAK